jgi:hypothetical protein
LGKIKTIFPARPSVGDVQEQQFGAEDFGEPRDLRQHGFVRRTVFERD